MNRTSLARRLAAGAAGLLIGATGALALTSPAQAYGNKEIPSPSNVEFVDDCDGTWVNIYSGTFIDHYEWTVWHEGGEGSELVDVPSGGEASLIVPSEWTDVAVNFEGSPYPNWTHTWQEPAEGCEDPGDEDEDNGNELEPPDESLGEWDFNCEVIEVTLHNIFGEDLTLTFVSSAGDSVEVEVAGGESTTVEFPSAEGLTVDILFEGQSIIDPNTPIEITSEEWADEGCAGGEGGDDQLPVTGSSTLLIAGGALALLALGGGLYLVARRRQVSFTA